MNKKIRELATQAGQGTEFHIPPEFIERFAELVIRECALQVNWILAERGKTQADLIEEHFGVE